jgi:hypothetical protein
MADKNGDDLMQGFLLLVAAWKTVTDTNLTNLGDPEKRCQSPLHCRTPAFTLPNGD